MQYGDADPGHLTGDDARPVFAKHVRALSEKDWKENMDAKWESALAIWLASLEGSCFESNVGKHVKERFEKGDKCAGMLCVRDACGVKSLSTVLKPGRDLGLFVTWATERGRQRWPMSKQRLGLHSMD